MVTYSKKINFSILIQYEVEVDTIEKLINNRPEKCLRYKTPFETFNEEQAKCCT